MSEIRTVYSTILREWHAWYADDAMNGASGRTEEEAIANLRAKYHVKHADKESQEEAPS